MRFFFYGTLVDADVRRAVLGPQAPQRIEPATLRGWRRAPVRGRTYPVIVADPAAEVDGVLARGLSAAAKHRLERYEDVDLYALAELDVLPAGRAQPVPALVFVARTTGVPLAPGTWEFAPWQRRYKQRYLLTLR